MRKSAEAFRTISEVGEILDVPAHVLRFWESKFTQIKPIKRGGGRRYYRPDDVKLIRSIQHLLHEQGMTIKGAQKLLREQGLKATVEMGQQLMDDPSEIKQNEITSPQDQTENIVKEESAAPAGNSPEPTEKPAPLASDAIQSEFNLEIPKPSKSGRLAHLQRIYQQLAELRSSIETQIANYKI